MSFDTMLRPRSIAVVGASENTSKVGYAVLANLLAEDFSGDIYPINLKKDTILGKNISRGQKFMKIAVATPCVS
jgi:acyl-CoA synthetase (NDP forming)